MTINGVIGALNVVVAVSWLALGCGLLWRSRARWREWPVGARIALAGPYLLGGLFIAQLALWRSMDLPHHLEANGWGTLLLRATLTATSIGLVWRVYGGTLLTVRDREGSG